MAPRDDPPTPPLESSRARSSKAVGQPHKQYTTVQRDEGGCFKKKSTNQLLSDGTINAQREHTSKNPSRALFNWYTGTNWVVFILMFLVHYCGIAFLFAIIYWLLDKENISSPGTDGAVVELTWGDSDWILNHAMYSFGAMLGVNVGRVAESDTTRVLSCVMNWCVVVTNILFTGLVLFRMTTPSGIPIMFSSNSIIHTHYGRRAFTFRVANQGKKVLVNVSLDVICQRTALDQAGNRFRRYYNLKIANPAMHWVVGAMHTVMHEIDSTSPLYKLDEEMMDETELEFVCVLSGYDSGTGQRIQITHVYQSEDIVWHGQFKEMIDVARDGRLKFDYGNFNTVQVEH